MPQVAERYHRLEGIELGEIRGNARRVKIGGLWSFVPLSVIHSAERGPVGALDADEIVVLEWFAKSRGWC